MTLFPTEPSASNVASKHEELDSLYAGASKVRKPLFRERFISNFVLSMLINPNV
jgi:hypothetical protein